MKSLVYKSLTALLLCHATSHAIFGIGGHWAPNLSAKTDNINEIVAELPYAINGVDAQLNASLMREEAKELQGFGFKMWVDILPFIDVEATVNFQVDTYASSILLNYPTLDGTTVTQEIEEVPLELDVEGGDLFSSAKAKPVFGMMMIDLSATYPFELPLPIIQWKFYAGGGLTYFHATPLVTKELAKAIAEKTLANIASAASDPSAAQADPAAAAQELGLEIANQFKEQGIESGVGGHALVGTRLSAALIPIAIYANGKYHFGGVADGVNHGITVEIGGGLAF